MNEILDVGEKILGGGLGLCILFGFSIIAFIVAKKKNSSRAWLWFLIGLLNFLSIPFILWLWFSKPQSVEAHEENKSIRKAQTKETVGLITEKLLGEIVYPVIIVVIVGFLITTFSFDEEPRSFEFSIDNINTGGLRDGDLIKISGGEIDFHNFLAYQETLKVGTIPIKTDVYYYPILNNGKLIFIYETTKEPAEAIHIQTESLIILGKYQKHAYKVDEEIEKIFKNQPYFYIEKRE